MKDSSSTFLPSHVLHICLVSASGAWQTVVINFDDTRSLYDTHLALFSTLPFSVLSTLFIFQAARDYLPGWSLSIFVLFRTNNPDLVLPDVVLASDAILEIFYLTPLYQRTGVQSVARSVRLPGQLRIRDKRFQTFFSPSLSPFFCNLSLFLPPSIFFVKILRREPKRHQHEEDMMEGRSKEGLVSSVGDFICIISCNSYV